MPLNRERSVRHVARALAVALAILAGTPAFADDAGAGAKRDYDNRLVPIADAPPLLADHPTFVQPLHPTTRLEAPALVKDPKANLAVRAWRFSYNARAVIEIPGELDGAQTAVIVVHPWGIDDGQGWRSPEPAGCAFQCTPAKNRLVRKHARDVVNPLLRSLRDRVALVVYSLPGKEDPVRKKLYRSVRTKPTPDDRARGREELASRLRGFRYEGKPVPTRLSLSERRPVVDYFRQFRGLDAGAAFNNEGFWELPVPVHGEIDVAPDDVVIYDAEGYELLKTFLERQGIRHVLLAGYNTDMCVISTTAGYQNLRRDFNVFLVGDATVATFPAQSTPACATAAAISFAALDLLITQCSWIKPMDTGDAQRGSRKRNPNRR